MIAAFGADAQAYAQRLGDVDAIVTDAPSLDAASAEALRRRARGETVSGMLCIDDARVAFGYTYAEQILAQFDEYDFRRFMMHQLAEGSLPVNRQRVDTIWPLPDAVRAAAAAFLTQCDALLVRSYAEHAAILEWTRLDAVLPVERVLAPSVVPNVTRVRPVEPSVVIWAPRRAAAGCALHVHALAEFHGELTCVSAGGPPPVRAGTTAFLGTGDPRVDAVLARAAAIVCVEPNDPSDAVAFARLNYGVVAALTCGAYEFAGDVVSWDALDARALFSAVAVAIGRPASVRGA